MDLVNITQEMYETSQRLDQASRVIHKMARVKAETERVYRMKLAQEMMTLKAEGMSVTLIADIARGNVSDLKFERDLAEGQYKAAIESMEAIKSRLSALQSILRYQEER
ncbi:hypothetical protein [Paenibacillus senegalensis]|uniref:hypothetical protein n=1 Tax=Paenibacillus senegalensis TaxID=1465766 RepID=UPI000289EDFC|nr:hypothetical protein [Paenibacillus senegalensis]